MRTLEVVCALIRNDKGEIFAARRGEGHTLEGLYEFPGGKVDAGETKEEAIVREIKEELDTTIKPLKYLGYISHDYLDVPNPFTIHLHAFEAEILEGHLSLLEHQEGHFFKKSELKELNFANADKKLIANLLN